MRVLDLFCGAGGAAMGLHRAWPAAEIVGVDTKPQPRYPFEFVQADAMTFSLAGFDFIWASPPCQAYSLGSLRWGRKHPDLVGHVRRRLRRTGTHFVIENVPRSPLRVPVLLCGQMFGLELVRHRLFECSFPVVPPIHPPCRGLVTGGRAQQVHGHGPSGYMYRRALTVVGHGGNPWSYRLADWKRAMGIDWMTRDEITQAVPPAYSEFVARQVPV